MTKSLKQIQQENRKFILEATLIGNNLRLLKENIADFQGAKLTLSRVLLASIKSGKCMDCFEHKNNKHCSSGWHLNTKDNSSRIRDFILDNWKNLELETLEEQAEEVQTKINELFNN